MHYATKCIIASSECATLKDASSAGHVNCFIAGHMTSDQPDTDVDFKEHLLHCFRSIWLVRCHVTGNKQRLICPQNQEYDGRKE